MSASTEPPLASGRGRSLGGASGALGPEQVAHVARLARLALDDEELARYTGQLASVLAHAADIAELEVEHLAPMAHPLPLRNVLRGDEPGACLSRDPVLAEAPEAEDGRFRVPPLLGEAP